MTVGGGKYHLIPDSPNLAVNRRVSKNAEKRPEVEELEEARDALLRENESLRDQLERLAE